MNVTTHDFKNALTLFMAELINTMSTPMQKFAAGLVYSIREDEIYNQLAPFVDANGLIDTDVLKKHIDTAMKYCGGNLEVPINFGILGAFGAPPINISIKLNDIEKFFGQTLPSVSTNLQK